MCVGDVLFCVSLPSQSHQATSQTPWTHRLISRWSCYLVWRVPWVYLMLRALTAHQLHPHNSEAAKLSYPSFWKRKTLPLYPPTPLTPTPKCQGPLMNQRTPSSLRILPATKRGTLPLTPPWFTRRWAPCTQQENQPVVRSLEGICHGFFPPKNRIRPSPPSATRRAVI